ncbi:hypothetical protein [Microbacterium testaceum]|uniref:DUF2510 domain-containing protein n=1 Tax=Microbacterium testaceum TaxID=2033 RepID=A0A147F9N4_MICTE|nr:hypothetical protein [Microbacterium testaceum]KTS13226.1 hypothetical protein RSA3_05575 [Microbacterium testaceum]
MDAHAAWYAEGEGLRWWDGSRWTGMRVADGRPVIDWITADRPAPLFVASALFFVAGAIHLFLVGFSPFYLVTAVLFLALSFFWLFGALHVRRVLRIPAPTTAPVVIDAVRPLPGEQEGTGAGWFPVSSTVSRWWTGTRWSQYTWTRSGIRPTFHGARSFRILLWVEGVITALGALLGIAGIVVAVSSSDADVMTVAVGTIVVGAVLFLLGGVLLALSPLSRRPLVVPSTPPAPLDPAAGGAPAR